MPVHVLISYRASEPDLARIRAVSDALAVHASESREHALELAAQAEVILAGHWSNELWQAAPRLKWVQSWGAGIERFMTSEFIASPVLLTNAAGVYAIPIADHVLALMLHFSRGLARLLHDQIARCWGEEAEPDELAGKTLGIVGLGGIGGEVARRAKAFGMRVIATRRRPELPAEFADEVRGADGLPWLLAESDYVVLCTALTQSTRQLIGPAELRAMKPTAYLMNIGRGGLIDEPALIAALKDNRIAGAGLDVFATEPLPADSPFWYLPNVLITPHLAGSSPRSHERLMDLFCDNLRRYLAGEELLNVVDKREGY
jgi:phosphoglycerate dehydrogenase-like enzyme